MGSVEPDPNPGRTIGKMTDFHPELREYMRSFTSCSCVVLASFVPPVGASLDVG